MTTASLTNDSAIVSFGTAGLEPVSLTNESIVLSYTDNVQTLVSITNLSIILSYEPNNSPSGGYYGFGMRNKGGRGGGPKAQTKQDAQKSDRKKWLNE